MFLAIIIAFFSIIGLMVFHEFGHFIIAKKFGVKVEEFGLGYPPRLFGKKIGETVYSINLLPFGALVRVLGEEGQTSGVEDSRTFSRKPIWQRALIVFGGAASFWIIAFILFSIIFFIGTSQVISDEETGFVNPTVQIVAVAPGSPAEKAGLRMGDTIKQFSISDNQFSINKIKDVQELTEANKGKEVILTIQRGKEIFTALLTPRVSFPEGEGSMGVALARIAEKSYPLWYAPIKGAETTISFTGAIIGAWSDILRGLIFEKTVPKGVQFMGPIGIGVIVSQAFQVGISYFLRFLGMISVYLAVFNLLPIPALDGGKLLFLGIEKIRKKAVPLKTEQSITSVFFGLLILIMVWVTVKDIIRLF